MLINGEKENFGIKINLIRVYAALLSDLHMRSGHEPGNSDRPFRETLKLILSSQDYISEFKMTQLIAWLKCSAVSQSFVSLHCLRDTPLSPNTGKTTLQHAQ